MTAPHFAGWQTQRDHPKGRSVQGEIERGFQQLFAREIAVNGSGRTDSGVHARGMVAHIEFPDEIAMRTEKLLMAINATTPKDIAIRDIHPVAEDFHARHSALARQYRYTIRQERTAIDRHFVWAIRRKLDFDSTRTMRRRSLPVSMISPASANEHRM